MRKAIIEFTPEGLASELGFPAGVYVTDIRTDWGDGKISFKLWDNKDTLPHVNEGDMIPTIELHEYQTK